MKKFVRFFKPLSFLPALLILFTIFSFSEQTGEVSGQLSYEITCQLVKTGSSLFHVELTQKEFTQYVQRFHYPVRKLAHMSEYALLALSLSIPFSIYGWKNLGLFLLSFLLCILFASMDEFHQSFVAGRGPSVIDVGFDSMGAFISLSLHHLFLLSKAKQTDEPSET